MNEKSNNIIVKTQDYHFQNILALILKHHITKCLAFFVKKLNNQVGDILG